MPDKKTKQGILKKILSDYIKTIKGAKEAAKNYASTGKTYVKLIGIKGSTLGGQRTKLVDKMMKKYYPPYTVVQGGTKTHKKRWNEAYDLVKQGKMKQAREYLQKLKEQFKKNNPNYHG